MGTSEVTGPRSDSATGAVLLSGINQHIHRFFNGEAFTVRLQALDFMEGISGQIALPAMGTVDNRDIFHHKDIVAFTIRSGDSAHPRPRLAANVAFDHFRYLLFPIYRDNHNLSCRTDFRHNFHDLAIQ